MNKQRKRKSIYWCRLKFEVMRTTLCIGILGLAFGITSCSESANSGEGDSGDYNATKKISAISCSVPRDRIGENLITLDNIFYDSVGRLRRFNFKEDLSHWSSYYGGMASRSFYSAVDISYSSNTITINEGKSLTEVIPFTMNGKGYLTSLSHDDGPYKIVGYPDYIYDRNIRYDFTYNNDYLSSIKYYAQSTKSSEEYLFFEVKYEWKDGVIVTMKKITYDISYAREHPSESKIFEENDVNLSYTNKANRNYIFPVVLGEDCRNYKLCKLINTIGMNGMLGRCPTLLPQESSSGDYYSYELDNDGYIVEYTYTPANSGLAETSVLKYQ